MTAADLPRIGREIAAARNAVPFQNRAKFDAESRDFFNAMYREVHGGDAARADALLAAWNDRLQLLTGEPRCHAAPPCLVRGRNESVADYIGRCINAKGK